MRRSSVQRVADSIDTVLALASARGQTTKHPPGSTDP
jgi:hypothetical protein